MSHPGAQISTLKKTVLKIIASTVKIRVARGPNGTKMVLLPVYHVTTRFRRGLGETAETSHTFIFGAWRLGAWDSPAAPAQQPRPLKGTRKEDKLQCRYPVARPCVSAPVTEPLGAVLGTRYCAQTLYLWDAEHFRLLQNLFYIALHVVIATCFLNLNVTLNILKDFL